MISIFIINFFNNKNEEITDLGKIIKKTKVNDKLKMNEINENKLIKNDELAKNESIKHGKKNFRIKAQR